MTALEAYRPEAVLLADALDEIAKMTHPPGTKSIISRSATALRALSPPPVHAGEGGRCFECETELVGPLCPECNPEIKAALSWSPAIGEALRKIAELSSDGRRTANLPVINRIANAALAHPSSGEDVEGLREADAALASEAFNLAGDLSSGHYGMPDAVQMIEALAGRLAALSTRSQS